MHAEEAGPPRQGHLAGFGQHHAAGVLRVLLQRVEMDAPHRILHVELILEAIRDRLRVAGDQQVVGDLVGVGWPRPDALARQPRGLRLVRAEGLVAGILVIMVAGLAAAQIQQLLERVHDGRRAVAVVLGEEDAPAGFGQLCGIDVVLDAQEAHGLPPGAPRQLGLVLRRAGALDKALSQFFRGLRPQQICAGRAVDAVEVEKFTRHGISPVLLRLRLDVQLLYH